MCMHRYTHTHYVLAKHWWIAFVVIYSNNFEACSYMQNLYIIIIH